MEKEAKPLEVGTRYLLDKAGNSGVFDGIDPDGDPGFKDLEGPLCHVYAMFNGVAYFAGCSTTEDGEFERYEN